jgi:hypothetical protein
MSKSKIIPGKGFQYTPQTTIEWADDFNELLESHNSRNELVSKLIEDGLKVQNGFYKEQGIYLPLDSFSNEELTLLKTEEGKKILYNVVSLILGNSAGVAVAQQMVQQNPQVDQSVAQPMVSSNVKTEDEKEEKRNKEGKESSEALSKLLKLGKMTNLKG